MHQLTDEEVLNIRWMLPGELDLFVNSVFGVSSLEQQTRRLVQSNGNGQVGYTAEEKATALLYETIDLIIREGTIKALQTLKFDYELTALQAREVVRTAREEMRSMLEGDTAAQFFEIQARIEDFISRCRTGADRREEAVGLKMIMQLHGFTRDRDLGGMREIADTLKRLNQRALVIDHEVIESGEARPTTYDPRPGTTRKSPIKIPEKAKR